VVLGSKLDCEEDSTPLWMEVLMRCFVVCPVTTATCIRECVATRGCSLVVLEVQWSVWDRGSYGWVPEDCPPR